MYKLLPNSRLVGYIDNDWVGFVNDIRDMPGYAFALRLEIFTWASKKQVTIVQLSIKVKYITIDLTISQEK